MRTILLPFVMLLGCAAPPSPDGSVPADVTLPAEGAQPAPRPHAAASPDPDASSGSLPRGVSALSIPPTARDLAPLDEIAGRVHALGIGESAHTSGGFVDTKAALVRHLVEMQGFRAIAFESPRNAVAAKMAPYVASCTGDPVSAMEGLFAVWWTPSTRDLMAWLCAFNHDHPADPVRVAGFDIQQPEDDAAGLKSFVPRVASEGGAALVAGMATCSAKYDASTPYPKSDYEACLKGLDAIDAYFRAHAAAIESAVGADAFSEAKLASLGFRAWQTEHEMQDSDPKASFEARDVGMAAVFRDQRARALAGKKVILWAHDYHLTERHTEVLVSSFVPGAQTMGTLVREEMGGSYATIGLVGHDVQMNMPPAAVGHVADPSPNAYESLLHRLGRPSLFVRLDRTSDALAGSVSRPVGTPAEETMAPAHQFDALLYLDVSLPMPHLGW